MEDEVVPASTMACPCVEGVEVGRAADISVLTPRVGERLASTVSVAQEMPEVEATGLGLAGLCVMSSAVPAANGTLVMPAVDRVENTSAMGGWDVVAKCSSVVLLVLLCCGLGVTAVELSREDEEWLVTAELGPRGMEEAPPLTVAMPVAVMPDPVEMGGLIPSLLTDTPRELQSPVSIVGSVSVLSSPPTIFIVEGDRKDVSRGE
ncbi:hypothetical protein WISP_50671 [Willisornis vidua]|uniref:Uncharacterized protein n=1 Tax=Willisornis vidua TaxID=1566151 RepID=A0ABQ9DDT7_9PASS|nr:hypothetical protein WISP_50671 [Willisornis vidua]